MAGEANDRPIGRERRGLDPAILQFIHTLLDDHAEAHRREHAISEEATKARIELAAERLEELAATSIAARRELFERITEHYDTILKERDDRYTERLSSGQAALERAAKSAQDAVAAALKAAKDETTKTEETWVKQADAQYVKTEALSDAISKVVPREESEATKKEVDRRLGEIDRRMTILEAAKAGKTELLPWVVAAVSLAALLFQLRGR